MFLESILARNISYYIGNNSAAFFDYIPAFVSYNSIL